MKLSDIRPNDLVRTWCDDSTRDVVITSITDNVLRGYDNRNGAIITLPLRSVWPIPCVVTHTTTYAPWEEDQEERTELHTFTEHVAIDPEPGESLVDAVADLIPGYSELSQYPVDVDSEHVWWTAELYTDPYTGETEERSYNLRHVPAGTHYEVNERVNTR